MIGSHARLTSRDISSCSASCAGSPPLPLPPLPPSPLPPAAALAFVKSTPRPSVRSFRLVSFAYNHAQSPLLVHPFLLASLRPLSTPSSSSPSPPFLSFFRVATSTPPPVFTYSFSSTASPRLSLSLCLSLRPLCKLTSGSIVSTCRCLRSPPLGYLTALLPSLLNHSVSCPYRRMRTPPRFSLCLSILSSFTHPTLPPAWSDPDARVPPSSEGFLASAADHRAFFILATPVASNNQHCSSDSGF